MKKIIFATVMLLTILFVTGCQASQPFKPEYLLNCNEGIYKFIEESGEEIEITVESKNGICRTTMITGKEPDRIKVIGYRGFDCEKRYSRLTDKEREYYDKTYGSLELYAMSKCLKEDYKPI